MDRSKVYHSRTTALLDALLIAGAALAAYWGYATFAHDCVKRDNNNA